MATSLYELREEVDRLTAVYETLLRLWQQDLARVIGELGAGLDEVRDEAPAGEDQGKVPATDPAGSSLQAALRRHPESTLDGLRESRRHRGPSQHCGS